MKSKYSFSVLFPLFLLVPPTQQQTPLVITTWEYPNATGRAWDVVNSPTGNAIDAIVEGCSLCERMQCRGTVGFGGSPDENGETTLDAMIYDGRTMNMGAVAALRDVKDAIAVARHVLENTKHSLIVGSQATEFAVQMGFEKESLQTDSSRDMWETWKNASCQPNNWLNVSPDPTTSCGPYEPVQNNEVPKWSPEASVDIGPENHDTIGMIVIDRQFNVVAGTSTNGKRNKIPGRVGDSPIPGAGGYADNFAGAAVATGDGDIMMRFVPAFLAVEELKRGATPYQAAKTAVNRIATYYPDFSGAIVVADKYGDYGVACNGWETFTYSVRNIITGGVKFEIIPCVWGTPPLLSV